MTIRNNKTIAINTAFLYFRMILTMGVALFSVRIVLRSLGVLDYGIYNVIFGIVTLLSFLSNSIATTAQRYYCIEIGNQNNNNVNVIFNTSIIIFLLFSIVTIILAESIGLWIINKELIIPENRIIAANWVFQISILSFIITILTMPYNYMLISYENMNLYAVISIVESIAKLLVAVLIKYSKHDKLVSYSFLLLISTTLTFLVVKYIVTNQYKNLNLTLKLNKDAFKNMIAFTKWKLIGSLSSALSDHGINTIMNVFFGPTINAAKAIANQINTAIVAFSNNFYLAVQPQIVKQYATGNSIKLFDLVFNSTRYSYYILLVLSLPVLYNMPLILGTWLDDTVTESMVMFSRLTLIYSLVNSLENPISTMVQASGSIKTYQLLIGSISIMCLPISFFLYKIGLPPHSSYFVLISISITTLIVRLLFVKSKLSMPITEYLKNVIIRILSVTVLAFSLSHIILKIIILKYNKNLLIESIIIVCIAVLSILIFGLSTAEKNKLLRIILN